MSPLRSLRPAVVIASALSPLPHPFQHSPPSTLPHPPAKPCLPPRSTETKTFPPPSDLSLEQAAPDVTRRSDLILESAPVPPRLSNRNPKTPLLLQNSKPDPPSITDNLPLVSLLTSLSPIHGSASISPILALSPSSKPLWTSV
jgi:hypothetical protein